MVVEAVIVHCDLYHRMPVQKLHPFLGIPKMEAMGALAFEHRRLAALHMLFLNALLFLG